MCWPTSVVSVPSLTRVCCRIFNWITPNACWSGYGGVGEMERFVSSLFRWLKIDHLRELGAKILDKLTRPCVQFSPLPTRNNVLSSFNVSNICSTVTTVVTRLQAPFYHTRKDTGLKRPGHYSVVCHVVQLTEWILDEQLSTCNQYQEIAFLLLSETMIKPHYLFKSCTIVVLLFLFISTVALWIKDEGKMQILQ